MSTKSTIRSGDCWHVYEEVFDGLFEEDKEKVPVYLNIVTDGRSSSLELDENGVASVTVRIPRWMAVEMGIMPAAKTPQ